MVWCHGWNPRLEIRIQWLYKCRYSLFLSSRTLKFVTVFSTLAEVTSAESIHSPKIEIRTVIIPLLQSRKTSDITEFLLPPGNKNYIIQSW